jgi:hypothetical protein
MNASSQDTVTIHLEDKGRWVVTFPDENHTYVFFTEEDAAEFAAWVLDGGASGK